MKDILSPDLYRKIQRHYDDGHYKDAVIEALRFLTEIIRVKSGCDGDGAQLVGKAFEGDNPKIKFNKLQTQSENDEQKGFATILRGIYIGIRNPRTHEEYVDDKLSADSMLYFFNYLLLRINKAKIEFNDTAYLERIFDPLFVEKNDYADMLITEIPFTDMIDVGCKIFEQRKRSDSGKLIFVFTALFKRMNEEQQRALLGFMSRELEKVINENEIVCILRLISGHPHLWKYIEPSVKLRIENKLIESIKNGYYDIYKITGRRGALGTWAGVFGPFFNLRRDLSSALVALLAGGWHTQNYVGTYFLHLLPDIIVSEQFDVCCQKIAYAAYQNRAIIVKDELEKILPTYPNQWQTQIKQYAMMYSKDDEDDEVK